MSDLSIDAATRLAPVSDADAARPGRSALDRRAFLATTGLGGAAALQRTPPSTPSAAHARADRPEWVRLARRLADPVLTNLSRGTLKKTMPVEEAAGANRATVTHLEALGRLLAGLAPWLELDSDASDEGRLREDYARLARAAIASAVDPASPDALNFTEGRQPLVDAAFLAQALLRAPRALWGDLDPQARARLVRAFESTRIIPPGFNNWLLFSATIEAALKHMSAPWDRMRIDYALRQHEQWYKGDGVYGDGPEFHWDYYNSFVIQPMLLDVLDEVGDDAPAWKALREPMTRRAQRYAAILERLIAPDGSFPPIGRSIAYRAGAFQVLADMAFRQALPADLSPGQVRPALTAVMTRTLGAPGTFDEAGWLRIGLAGHQPGVGERYISTGSLYLCAVALLPLGLSPAADFWTAAPQRWTAQRAWGGEPFPIDKAGG